ncbi:hypothetical protein REPUB_Repub07fG0200600 [Reevesia pubescens]
MDIRNEGSSDCSDQEITPKCMKVKEEKWGLDETISVNQNIAVDYSADTCSLDLVLGIANQAEIKLEADCGKAGKLRSPGVPNELITPLNRLHFNEKTNNGTIDNSIIGSVRRYAKHTKIHEPQSASYSVAKLAESLSPNSSSPESILRISAMTFKNTPSIIRKRSYKKAWNDNFSDAACSPVRTFSCFHWEGEINSTC